MNRKIKWAVATVGAVALAGILLVPAVKNYAKATVPVPVNTAAVTSVPRYGDFVVPAAASNPAPQYNGNYPPQNFYNYMYGMMGYMMGGYWGGQGQSGTNGQGNYPYYGMMGGFGYQGQSGTQGQYPPPYYNNNGGGGVSGNVYGQ